MDSSFFYIYYYEKRREKIKEAHINYIDANIRRLTYDATEPRKLLNPDINE
jgi:hypothetical protein